MTFNFCYYNIFYLSTLVVKLVINSESECINIRSGMNFMRITHLLCRSPTPRTKPDYLVLECIASCFNHDRCHLIGCLNSYHSTQILWAPKSNFVLFILNFSCIPYCIQSAFADLISSNLARCWPNISQTLKFCNKFEILI